MIAKCGWTVLCAKSKVHKFKIKSWLVQFWIQTDELENERRMLFWDTDAHRLVCASISLRATALIATVLCAEHWQPSLILKLKKTKQNKKNGWVEGGFIGVSPYNCERCGLAQRSWGVSSSLFSKADKVIGSEAEPGAL